MLYYYEDIAYLTFFLAVAILGAFSITPCPHPVYP